MNNPTTATEVLNIAEDAKALRALVKKHGAVMSVRINRQWEKVQQDPCSVMYCQGGMGGFGIQLEKSIEFRKDIIAFAHERGLHLIGVDPLHYKPWMHSYTLKRDL
jgi:kynurenine formamidase